MNTHACQKWIAIFCALILTGCASPMVRWNQSSPTTPGMPGALEYADKARDAYRSAVADQMDRETSLASGLVVTGALVAALAAGGAHRNAILGVSLAGGTAYTLGNMNLRRPTVMIYLAGVDALNCARRAVLHFNISSEELRDLGRQLSQLESSRRRLGMAVAKAQSVTAVSSPSDPQMPALTVALAAATQVQASADSALKSGRKYTESANRAAGELIATVNLIDAAVVRSLVESTPALNNVPSAISGLAGMAGQFAPGAGVDAGLSDALQKSKTMSTNPTVQRKRSNVPPETIEELILAASETLLLTQDVNDRLTGRVVTWPEDAFKDCGVAQVITALATSPASLSNLVAGTDDRRSIEISGGVKPYFAELEGVPIDGITLKPPIRFDTRAELSITGSKVTKTYALSIRITDSSPTARVVNVPVTITAANTTPVQFRGSSLPGTQAQRSRDTRTADAALAAISRLKEFYSGGRKFVFPPSTPPSRIDTKTLEVTVTCPSGNAGKYSQAVLSQALLFAAGITSKPSERDWSLRLKSTDDCLAE